MTLLIIDVVAAGTHVEPDEALVDHLLAEWSTLVAYVVGFATILVCWINHHRVFHYVTRTDSGLVWVKASCSRWSLLSGLWVIRRHPQPQRQVTCR